MGYFHSPLPGLVERILAAKRRDAEADVSALERELDQLVDALYLPAPSLWQADGLTEAEKALAKNFTGAK